MKITILSILSIISVIVLSSFSMKQEADQNKIRMHASEEISFFELIPVEILTFILTQVVTQPTLEEALDQIEKLTLVNKQFNQTVTYLFTIEKFAKQFTLTPRTVALRIIRKLNLNT